MSFSAKILVDSISPKGIRLTTFELVYPRIVHAEVMTHRVFSRNAASSRALPVNKMIKMVRDNPYIPTHWGKNQSGMQAEHELTEEQKQKAKIEWLKARDYALDQAKALLDIGLHKQITNRLLEPFQWYTIIVTGTEWSNFFNLRNHPDAHPDIQQPAKLTQELYFNSTPKALEVGEWHLPLIQPDEWSLPIESLIKISIGRCARVSYLTHAGIRDISKDIGLYDRLLSAGHMSPTEHVATPYDPSNSLYRELGMSNLKNPNYVWFGNFKGWVQYRKTIVGEADILAHRRNN